MTAVILFQAHFYLSMSPLNNRQGHWPDCSPIPATPLPLFFSVSQGHEPCKLVSEELLLTGFQLGVAKWEALVRHWTGRGREKPGYFSHLPCFGWLFGNGCNSFMVPALSPLGPPTVVSDPVRWPLDPRSGNIPPPWTPPGQGVMVASSCS